MFNVRGAFYNALLLLAVILPGVWGCGKPTAPPPGAPQETSSPAIELGSETGPKENPASTPNSPSGGGPTQGEQEGQK